MLNVRSMHALLTEIILSLFFLKHCHSYIAVHFVEMFMPQWAEPRRHTVVVACVCEWVSVSFREVLFAFSPWSLNIKGWNVHCKLNAMLSWNRIGEFWIKDFIVELWRDLLTLTTVFHYPESVELRRTDWFPTWQYYLYHKTDDDFGETSRTLQAC